MAELDNKKKNPQDIGYTDFQEEYEKHNNQPEEEKKGFFQRLWEGIQKIFGAIRDFIVNIFRPVDYTIMTEEQIKKYQNQQHPPLPLPFQGSAFLHALIP